jgi:hypothetical protein
MGEVGFKRKYEYSYVKSIFTIINRKKFEAPKLLPLEHLYDM